MKSVLQSKKECYICRKKVGKGIDLPDYALHKHHVMHGTANRKIADDNGVWVWLCPYHHEFSNDAVHVNRNTDLILIMDAQDQVGREKFFELFGRNYG